MWIICFEIHSVPSTCITLKLLIMSRLYDFSMYHGPGQRINMLSTVFRANNPSCLLSHSFCHPGYYEWYGVQYCTVRNTQCTPMKLPAMYRCVVCGVGLNYDVTVCTTFFSGRTRYVLRSLLRSAINTVCCSSCRHAHPSQIEQAKQKSAVRAASPIARTSS